MATTNQPTAPGSLPKYLAEGVPKQDVGTLDDLAEYVEAMIEYKNSREGIAEELPANREIASEADGQTGWIVHEHVKCGDETCWCADAYPDDGHGPYRYRYWREEGTMQCEYVENEM